MLMWIKSFPSLFEISEAFAREKTFVFTLRKKNPVLVGTGDDAISTTDTFVLIYRHDPILTLMRCTCGTDFDTRGLLTLIASDWICGYDGRRPVSIRLHSY
jgi:hypothetical protein